jgi:hypothetical protein
VGLVRTVGSVEVGRVEVGGGGTLSLSLSPKKYFASLYRYGLIILCNIIVCVCLSLGEEHLSVD